MILLNDEEIDEIVIIPPLNRRSEEDLLYYSRKRDRAIAKAQLKKVAEYLKEHSHGSKDTWHQEIDKDDWQALLEEMK